MFCLLHVVITMNKGEKKVKNKEAKCLKFGAQSFINLFSHLMSTNVEDFYGI